MQEDVYQGDGLNLYAYCHNNPVMYFDLSGYDEGLFVDKVVYGEKHDSIELRFQLLKHMTGDEDLKKGTIRIKSHETQHVFPTQQDTNPALSIAGFQTNHYQNAVFDRNRGVNGKDASSLADFLSKYSIRRDVKKQYIANNTHHGVYTDKKTTVFAHKAYTDYVYYKVDKETSEFNINERMQKYSGGKIEQLEGVRLEMNKNMVKDEKSGKMITEITALRNKLLDVKDYFKKRNLAGIDLYLEHPKNKKIKNYYTHDNNGKIRTEKEAMEYFAQKNFKDNDYVYEEKNKSNGCGGAK